jgi:hypothetical protein
VTLWFGQCHPNATQKMCMSILDVMTWLLIKVALPCRIPQVSKLWNISGRILENTSKILTEETNKAVYTIFYSKPSIWISSSSYYDSSLLNHSYKSKLSYYAKHGCMAILNHSKKPLSYINYDTVNQWTWFFMLQSSRKHP